MPSPETNRRLTSMGLFLLPLIVVKAASGLMGSGPAPSTATAAPAAVDPAAAPGASPLAKVEWTQPQRAAAEYLRHLATTSFGPAPMLYTAAAEKPLVTVVPEVTAPDAPEPEMPEFVLQAVMTAAGGDKALINGRMYLVGQTIAQTKWTVREINADARSVTLAESDGTRSVTIAVQRPNN